jgi:hypothetical protein
LKKIKYFLYLIILLSIACTYQADKKEVKEFKKNVERENIFLTHYGYDLTKARILDTLLAFTKMTDSTLIKEYKSIQDLEETLYAFTIFRHTIDSILYYDYPCKLVKKNRIFSTTDSIDIFIYKYYNENYSTAFFFLDKNQNMLSSHELHYRTTILFYQTSMRMKEEDKQLLVKQIKEMSYNGFISP